MDRIDTEQHRVRSDQPLDLASASTRYEGELGKREGKRMLAALQERVCELQAILHAQRDRALLIVLQAMDAGGKDSTVRRVFGPLNPNWCHVHSFKRPCQTELARDFLWRVHAAVPPRGSLGIFNRSQYEDVVIARVRKLAPAAVIEKRYAHINEFERLLHDEGTTVRKFFLHISPGYQKERFQRRLRRPDKHWKFDPQDIEERKLWKDYQRAYTLALMRCSTEQAPWYIVPGERRWYRDLVIAQVACDALAEMDLHYPPLAVDPDEVVID